MGQRQNLHSGPSTFAFVCTVHCMLYVQLDNLHLHSIVSTVRSAGQSTLARNCIAGQSTLELNKLLLSTAAQIILSPAQRGKEKANFCSDSLSDARRMFVELVL